MLIQSSDSNKGNLTPYPEGSIKEVLHVSSPLMISYLSGYLMLFVGRVILARFSTEAMNAAATIGLVCYIFDYGLIGITAIVEVLVGKLNGAQKFTRMGEPVWQAIWLCIFSFALCVPLALFGSIWLVPKIYREIGTQYYLISMLTCPLFGIAAAFGSFFIGQGKGHIVTVAVIASNVINLILSLMLVFGFWFVPKLGITGAAVATLFSQIIQVIILACVFFSKQNRTRYGSMIWRFNYNIFKSVLNLGLPNSLSHVLEISAWSLIGQMLAMVNNDQVTLFSLGQSLFILFAFFSEGLQKGVMAISSNFIGAKKYHLIPQNVISASYVHLVFCMVLLAFLLTNPSIIVKMFFPVEEQISMLFDRASTNCLWVLLYFALDGLVWIRSAILISFGDVKFIMLANITNVAVFAVLPIYLFIVRTNGASTISSWQIVSVSAVINLLVFSYRSKRKMANAYG